MTPLVITILCAIGFVIRAHHQFATWRFEPLGFDDIGPVATLSCDAPSRGRFTAPPAFSDCDARSFHNAVLDTKGKRNHG